MRKIYPQRLTPIDPHNPIWKIPTSEKLETPTPLPRPQLATPARQRSVQWKLSSAIEANRYWSNKKTLNLLVIRKQKTNFLLNWKFLKKKPLMRCWKFTSDFKYWLAWFGVEKKRNIWGILGFFELAERCSWRFVRKFCFISLLFLFIWFFFFYLEIYSDCCFVLKFNLFYPLFCQEDRKDWKWNLSCVWFGFNLWLPWLWVMFKIYGFNFLLIFKISGFSFWFGFMFKNFGFTFIYLFIFFGDNRQNYINVKE